MLGADEDDGSIDLRASRFSLRLRKATRHSLGDISWAAFERVEIRVGTIVSAGLYMRTSDNRTPIHCWQIDAFTDRPFGGNPAAVCWLDAEADPKWMQDVAAE